MTDEISPRESTYAEFAATTLIYATLLLLLWVFAGQSWEAVANAYGDVKADWFTMVLGALLAFGVLECYVRFRKRKE